MKEAMSPFDIAGQLQQRPSPGGGGIFDTTWWRYFDPTEKQQPFDEICSSWDLAFADTDTSAYTVGQVWAARGDDRFLLRSVRDHYSFPALLEAVTELSAWVTRTYPRHRYPAVLVEKAANAHALQQTLKDEIPGIILVPPKGDKVTRAYAIVPLIQSGHVYLPGGLSPSGKGPDLSKTPAWVPTFLDETESFPRGRYKDQVDAMSQALTRIGHGPRVRRLV